MVKRTKKGYKKGTKNVRNDGMGCRHNIFGQPEQLFALKQKN